MISRYWQVHLNSKDQKKTAFCTPEGHFKKSIHLGYVTHLQHLVLAGLQWLCCLVYLNDVIIMGKDFQDHLQNLWAVFKKLREAG